MSKHNPIKSCAYRFRRFCRARWAAYSSMHREVTIGRLDARVADRSLAKAVATVGLWAVAAHGQAMAQADTTPEEVVLPAVEIAVSADTLFGSSEPAAVFSASQFNQSTIHSLADLLCQLPGVDIAQRGPDDVQGDLSMRGGSFDQMLVLLNGINLTDAQTGHHNLDVPIDIALVERVELLSPSQLMARGIVAFCGAVNIVVNDAYRDRLLAEATAGSYGTARASLLASKATGPWTLTAAANYRRSDGYMPNTDYRHGSLFLQALRHGERSDLHLQAGGQLKGFGSQAFYSTAYPDQYEATRTLTASAFHIRRAGFWRMETALYGRLHGDRFELFRSGYAQPAAWYAGHNHHLASAAGLRHRTVRRLGRGELLGGVELRREGIRSNVLGLPDSSLAPPYTKRDSRLSSTLFGGYHLATRRLQAEVVALGLHNSAFGLHYGLSGEATCHLTRYLDFRAALCRTFRLPTFTDLYYQGANQTSNPDLRPEAATSADIGLVARTAVGTVQAGLWCRNGVGVIDWVRRADEEMWYSMNHTRSRAYGVDAMAMATLGPTSLRLSYSGCQVAQDAGEWVSGATLEYLRHKLQAGLTLQAGRFAFQLSPSWRYRAGGYVDDEGQLVPYGGAWLLAARGEYALPHGLTLFAEGHNLLDTHYRDHGGVPQPGRTFLAGVRLDWHR